MLKRAREDESFDFFADEDAPEAIDTTPTKVFENGTSLNKPKSSLVLKVESALEYGRYDNNKVLPPQSPPKAPPSNEKKTLVQRVESELETKTAPMHEYNKHNITWKRQEVKRYVNLTVAYVWVCFHCGCDGTSN